MKRYRLVLFTAILLAGLSTTAFGMGQAAAGQAGSGVGDPVLLQPPNPCGPEPCTGFDEYGNPLGCGLGEFLVWHECMGKIRRNCRAASWRQYQRLNFQRLPKKWN